MNVEFARSRKGKPCLILDGQRYYRKAEKKGRTYWMCIRRGKCQSTAITQDSYLLASKPHNHDLEGNELPGCEGDPIKMKRLSTPKYNQSINYPYISNVYHRIESGGSSSQQYDESMEQTTYEDDESLLCEAEEIEEKFTPTYDSYGYEASPDTDVGTKRSNDGCDSPSSKKGKCDLIADQEPENITVTVDAERIPSPEITITKTSSSGETWSLAPETITKQRPRYAVTGDTEERRTLLDLETRRIAMEERRLRIEEEERKRRMELDERKLKFEEEQWRSKREIEIRKIELEERRVKLLERRTDPEITHWKKIDSFMQETMALFGKIITFIAKLQESKVSDKMMEVIGKVLDKQHNLMEVITNGDDNKTEPKLSKKTKPCSRPTSPIVTMTPTFTQEELLSIVDGVQEHIGVIQKDDLPDETWTYITHKVNSVNKDVKKSCEQVKRKWVSFKNNIKTKAMRTPPNLTELEMRVMEMIADESMEELEAAFEVESPRQFEKRRRISENSMSPRAALN